ncbi:MAG TPA: hypothetical protein VF704_01735 [Allosphingosinicella sp.]
MKEALTLVMLAMLILPVLFGVRRLRRSIRDRPPLSPPARGGDDALP